MGAQIWVNQAKIRSKIRFFCHFLKFLSLVFLYIAEDDNLEQCVTANRGKIHEKKIGSEISVFVIFLRLHH